MDQSRLPADVRPDSLPDHPDLALFVATLFQKLGGTLQIDLQGRRHARWPDRQAIWRNGIPQLHDATLAEQFSSGEEWQGAVKLAEYWLSRLSSRDKEYVFTTLASVESEPRRTFDFRARL